jgi:methionine-rich copper-binding protein CopC
MSTALRDALGLAAFLVLATGAFAHAFPDHAVPAVGSAVRAAPTSVRIWFTQELEPAFSTIKVLDAKGNVVAASDRAVDPSDRTLLRLPLPPLPPGNYKVVWRVLSVDSHVTEGDFTFTVAP